MARIIGGGADCDALECLHAYKKCCQLLVENIHITITFELPIEKVSRQHVDNRIIGMRMAGLINGA